jgi:hypothetical protein
MMGGQRSGSSAHWASALLVLLGCAATPDETDDLALAALPLPADSRISFGTPP